MKDLERNIIDGEKNITAGAIFFGLAVTQKVAILLNLNDLGNQVSAHTKWKYY